MKKISFLSVLFLLAALLYASAGNAQITVTPSATATTLANKLVGPGVIVISPTLTCPAISNGTFVGTSTLSFDSGIILTNGTAVNVANPVSFFASTANGTPGDPQLSALCGQPTNDACILEFDFRPIGDTVKFDYVFGSEEYQFFTCTVFNDVFGFFISGPGYGAPTNLALVPGTTIPVCINSVNCGPGAGFGSISTCNAMGPGSPFCAYYVDNLGMGGTTICYDGLTTTLTAIAHVTPCDTYHLKMGVADAVDDVLDSGVFLKAGSLTSTSITTSSLGINPADTGFGAQFCVRGCSPGMFIFHNNGSRADSIKIKFNIGGTAINGFDYTTIADSVVIPSGDSTDTLFIHGLPVPPTGPKIVELYILAPYSCGGVPVIVDSVALTIYDSIFVHINTPDTAICIGQDVHINASGDPALHYLWGPSGSLDNDTMLMPTATPTVTTTYTVNAVYPGSGCPPSIESLTIQVVYPPALNVGPAVQTICVGSPLHIGVVTTPPGAYTYSWTPTTYLDNATISQPVVTPGVVADAEYYVTVTTVLANCPTTDSFLLHVLPNDFTIMNPDTGICYPPGTYQVRAQGDSEFSYLWSPVNGVSDPRSLTPTLSPFMTMTYTVTGSYPGCPDMKHTIFYSIENPQVNIITTDTTFCVGSTVTLPVEAGPADSPYVLNWSPTSNLVDPTVLDAQFFSADPGVFKYYLTITSGLGCTSLDSVILRTSPPVILQIQPGDVTIQYGDPIQLDVLNFSAPAAGQLIYWWIPSDGSIDNPNINDPIARPKATTTYTVYGMNQFGCRDTVSETITVAYTNECMPTAFTPNNDGLNDVFKLCNLHGQKLVEFSIYNRWGQMVYHNENDPTKGWDGTFHGTPQDMGIYNYLYILAEPDGTNKTYKGDVTLIR
jgi:gliding motility-associated-like protein